MIYVFKYEIQKGEKSFLQGQMSIEANSNLDAQRLFWQMIGEKAKTDEEMSSVSGVKILSLQMIPSPENKRTI